MSKAKELFKIIGTLVLLILLTALVGVALGLMGYNPDSSVGGIIAVLVSQLVFGIATYFIIRKKSNGGKSYINDRGFQNDSWKMIIIGLGTAGFGNILLGMVINLLGEENPMVQNSYDMLNSAFSSNTTFQMIIQILVVVIIAPVVEEYLFRGYVFTECKKVYSLITSVILNGLLFGVFHMNLLQGINTFFFGIVLSLIYYHRSNIKDNILVHMTNNAAAILPVVFPNILNVLSITMILSIFIGIFLLVRICKFESDKYGYNI